MKRHVVAVVGLGLMLTPPLRGQERSYSATKDVVWTAVHEAFSTLQIAPTKEDKNKGEIQSDPAPTNPPNFKSQLTSEWAGPRGFGFAPRARLEVSLREGS